jgi:predicted DNA-binding transcriptional regulator AlpA
MEADFKIDGTSLAQVRLLTRPQVAELLSLTVEQFYRNRKRLEERGLPKPFFGNGRGARWSQHSIVKWICDEHQSAPVSAAPVSRADLDAQKLDARAAELAGVIKR